MALGDHGLQDMLLLLPTSLRDRAEEMASRECVSLNLFILMAVAEKLQRVQLQDATGISEKDDMQSDPASDSYLVIH